MTQKTNNKRKMRRMLKVYLKKGYTTREISETLKNRGISPNSIATVESELRHLRKEYRASNMFQLGYMMGREKSTS